MQQYFCCMEMYESIPITPGPEIRLVWQISPPMGQWNEEMSNSDITTRSRLTIALIYKPLFFWNVNQSYYNANEFHVSSSARSTLVLVSDKGLVTFFAMEWVLCALWCIIKPYSTGILYLFFSGTYSSIEDSQLDEIITCASNEHPGIGIRMLQGYLKGNGYRVQRERIRFSLLRTDPIGVVQRWRQTVKRRHYCVKSPLSLWHIDGNHKLIRYFAIINLCNYIDDDNPTMNPKPNKLYWGLIYHEAKKLAILNNNKHFVKLVIKGFIIMAPQRIMPMNCIGKWVVNWYYNCSLSFCNRWRVVIHGGVDGYSRIPVFLKASNNNKADTVMTRFLEAVNDYGLPSRVRSDRGGENVNVSTYMLSHVQRGPGRGSMLTGKYITQCKHYICETILYT